MLKYNTKCHNVIHEGYAVRIFKTKWFARFARKEGISDEKLSIAVQEAEKGLNDGELGGCLIKKRVARTGKGKRGGYRTVIVYRTGTRAVFVYGFPKSTKANLTAIEALIIVSANIRFL